MTTKKRIVVLDDDKDLTTLFRKCLSEEGYELEIYSDPESLLGKIDRQGPAYFDRPTVLICDINLPNFSGLEFVKRASENLTDIPIIFVTGHGTVESAVSAMKHGGFDYLTKPVDLTNLKIVCRRAMKFANLTFENRQLKEGAKSQWRLSSMIGKSEVMKKTFDLIKKVARTDMTVLVAGESGTGKELAARAIHELSPRSNQNFVAINCSSIPENLLESELFGHVKGAFTGAIGDKKGMFVEADGGSLFLDEIGDMPPLLQAKILRVLQEGKIKPVGSSQETDVDVRVIAATHKNLPVEIDEGRFREDLYFRLNVLPIALPPLREREDDILALADFFLRSFCESNNAKKSFAVSSKKKLLDHRWTGNVRELKNTVERTAVLSPNQEILPEDIVFDRYTSNKPVPGSELKFSFKPQYTLKEIEKEYIRHVLASTDGAKDKAASVLGIDRKTLYRKEKSYKIQTQ